MPQRMDLRADADDKAGMTLDELAAFVQRAMKADAPGGSVVGAQVTWRGKLKQITVMGGGA